MPRLFEGTGGSKRRPGLGSGSGSSTAAAGLGLALETANNNGNSNSQQHRRRRTAMDLLIDTDSSSSEDEQRREGGGTRRVADADSSSFDFGVSEPAKEKENSGNSNSSGKKKRQITVSDKAKAKTKTKTNAAGKKPAAKKRSAAASGKKQTTQQQQQAAGGTEKQKSTRKDTSNKAKAKAKPKAKTASTSASSRAAKSTTRKRSPTRVRFDDGTAENNDSGSAQAANDERGNMVSPQTSTGSTTTSSSSTASTPIPTIPIPPRAVAVDTRTVQSFGGDAAGAAFLRHTLAFLKSCARRGMLPPVLAVTAAAGGEGVGTKKRATAAIGVRVVHLPTDTLTGREYEVGGDDSPSSPSLSSSLSEAEEEEMYWRDLLLEAAVPVRCATAAQPSTALDGGVGGSGGVPKALLAHDSWKYFAELVASVDGQIQRDNNGAAPTTATAAAAATHHRRRPRALTIFTNDVALFSDTAVDSHKRALGRFWDTIRSSFRNGSVGSVQIAIYETGAAALMTGKSGRRQESHQPKESSASPLEGDSLANDGSDEDTATDEALAHRLRVKQCIGLLQREIQDLQEKDRRRSASPISVELQIIESPIRFQALLRDWIRAVVSTASGAGGTSSKISFDLPETLDGSQCSCSLDLVPSLLPHRVDSVEAAKLMMELKALSFAELEVVQVVPISSVDGSLLYGVPMSATAAMDSDLFRYKEMKVLTRQLFRYMATKDVALALRCVGTKSGDKENESALDASLDSTNASVNASIEEGQIFLLMAENPAEPTGQSLSSTSSSGSGAAPARGVLYRYATSDHLVHDPVMVDDCDSEDEETNEQYFEYVEQSLQMVDSAMLNPILVSSKAIPKKKKDPLSLDDLLSADMSDADSDTESPMNESSLETDGDAMVTESSLKSDREDGFGSFFDDDDDEDLRFFDNDFEYQ